MKKSIIWICSVIGVGAVLALLIGAWENRSGPEIIAVNGECITTVPRDKTAITLRVVTLAPTANESMRMATTQMAQITDFLETQPVQVQTTQFNSHEKSEWNRDEQKSVVLGIETSIAVEVSADSVQTIENVLELFGGMKDVYSENLRTYTSNAAMQPVLEKCLGVAMENARVRANAMVAPDKKHAGKMLSVAYGTNVGDAVPMPSNYLRAAKLTMAESAFDTSGTIVSRDTDVVVSVHAVFEIK